MTAMLETLGIGALAILGVVQGLTEFLPVSSTGHLILARVAFGLSGENGLAIDAVLQLATVLAVIVYFWNDLWALRTPERRSELVAILVGTIPGVIAGVFLEDIMATLFRSAHLVAYALIVGSLVMLAGEYLSRYVTPIPAGWKRGLFVGVFQALALVPGMSRSGMTIAGGMFAGFTRADAARFSFLLSVPILLGSGGKMLYELVVSGTTDTLGVPILVGGATAFVAGLVAIHLLLVIVRKTPLTVFVVYRIALALVVLAIV